MQLQFWPGELFSEELTVCELGGINSVRSYSFSAVEIFLRFTVFPLCVICPKAADTQIT